MTLKINQILFDQETSEVNNTLIITASLEFDERYFLALTEKIQLRDQYETQRKGAEIKRLLYERIVEQIQPQLDFENAFNRFVVDATAAVDSGQSFLPAMKALKQAVNIHEINAEML